MTWLAATSAGAVQSAILEAMKVNTESTRSADMSKSGAEIDIMEEIAGLEAAVREAQSVRPARVVVVDPPLLTRILAALKEAQTNGPQMRRGCRGEGSPWMGSMREVLDDYRAGADAEARAGDEARAALAIAEAKLALAVELLRFATFDHPHNPRHEREAGWAKVNAFLRENGK